MRNALSPIKMVIVAVLFSVGLSGAAQAKTTYLKCGLVSIAINVKDKKLIQSNYMDIIHFINELEVVLHSSKSVKNYIIIDRISLQYSSGIGDLSRSGTCQMGRQF